MGVAPAPFSMSLLTELSESPAQIVSILDQTNVDPVSSREDISRLCSSANSYGFFSVVVVPYHVNLARELLDDQVRLGTVIGFPYGVQTTRAKMVETQAVLDAVDEIDMVMNRTAFRNGDHEFVVDDIRRVKEAAPETVVKCIIESPALGDDEIAAAARLVEEAGADFVKTAVGYDGPTSPREIRLIREAVGEGIGIKASGGIATFEEALEMVDAGATRIGTSSGIEIVESIPE